MNQGTYFIKNVPTIYKQGWQHSQIESKVTLRVKDNKSEEIIQGNFNSS